MVKRQLDWRQEYTFRDKRNFLNQISLRFYFKIFFFLNSNIVLWVFKHVHLRTASAVFNCGMVIKEQKKRVPYTYLGQAICRQQDEWIQQN